MIERTDLSPLVPSLPQRGDSFEPAQVPVAASAPDLFSFQDYREYLGEWLQWKKRLQPHYSGALFAKKAGFNSHTLLGMVMRKQRNLSSTSIRAFSRALNLRGKEATYFEKLVLFNQARNDEDRAHYLEQLVAASQGKGRQLLTWTQNYAQYLSHWYVVAIRELAAVRGFKPDPERIAKSLRGKISPKQAEDAWKLLLTLGMVEQDLTNGGWKIVHPVLEIDGGPVDVSLKSFNKEYLDVARTAVDESSAASKHEITTLTLGIDAKDFSRLVEKVNEFRKQINLEFSVMDRPADQIVALNVQVLQLSEPAV